MGGGQSWHVPHVFGSGLPAGGGAHLAGSLADLPFVSGGSGAGLYRSGKCSGPDLA